MGDNKNARWLAGMAGLTAVGSVAGIGVVRSLRRRSGEDPYAGEDFTTLDADRGCVVTATDGVPLAVREVGPKDARLTVLFAHGFCNSMGSFHFQRARLAERWGDQVRMVFYDQRGHGRSSAGPVDSYTVPQLGQDLESVMRVMAPRGPVVLVGHSMGGMTVLSHARQFPRNYPARVCGVALIASAAQGVTRSPLGEVLQNPALEAAKVAVRFAPGAVSAGRGAAKAVIGPVLKAASFGDEAVSPSVARYVEKMMHDTSMRTTVEFLHALETHDEAGALPVLQHVPTLIACGDQDLLTPPAKSEAMMRQLPKSELVIVEGAGHMVHMEQPELINEALERFVEHATPSRLVALTRQLRGKAKRNG
ncbi:alpha/beta fold hydrolase [Mycolicibacterium aubagnense]|uniref:Alpha/beta hydrolase n=1 Tax=Mycolicibacterium aubagnense TaxID=319707 RepID=A0ABN5YUS3_9MYCO|nr:alpha/beta hydrolase [Mycolicibacterium aubagnense]TLH57538.1 alpha/beta hydrolase [Mycolicibacterium aubagnense]WGI34023.1 alpha/beta hydrolase [Mycolicibacterium aubagnense]BBX84184.1 alpha/beta hydrolase [Mycolicibacterium aubagnense]